MPQDAVDDLLKLLDLEPIEVNLFRGVSPDEDRQRVFGGLCDGWSFTTRRVVAIQHGKAIFR